MKTTLITLVLLFAFRSVLFAQVYVGGVPAEQQEAAPDKGKNTQSSGNKERYWHFGYVNAPMTADAAYAYGPFKSSAAPKPGFFFEGGAMRFFSDNFFLDNTGNIGLYSGSAFGVNFHDYGLASDFEGDKLPFFFVDFKVGPDIRFEVGNNLKFNLYGNIGGLMTYGGYVNSDDGNTVYNPTNPCFSLQTGFGLDVVYGKFVIGTQYNMAKGNFKFDITEDPYVYGEGAPYEEPGEYGVSLNSFKLHLGYYLFQ